MLAATAASGGRLVPLARVSPHHEDAVAEAQRCLAAGARGFKLHPRSDEFALPHPAVDEIVALADERRMPVLFHAGRGIPHLGEAVVDLARRYPGARLILAHAGISDLGWIARDAAELPNLFFDTAWWLVSDHLQLYATIPPGQILYASDMPYGPGLTTAFIFLRVARAVGLGGDAMRAIAGGQLDRIMAGDDPLDLGPGARAAPRSGRASSTPSASSPTAPPPCSCRSAGSTRPSRSRSPGSRAGPVSTTTPACSSPTSTGCSRSRSRTCATSRRRPARRRPRSCSR